MLVEAGEFLARLEGFLDLPAGSGYAHELGQPYGHVGLAAVERQLTGAAVAADQQPMRTSAGRVGGGIQHTQDPAMKVGAQARVGAVLLAGDRS